MDDVAAWLRQQFDTVESETRTQLYWAQQTILTLQDPKLLGKFIPGWHDWPKVEQMCIARLAEVDATRRILDELDTICRIAASRPLDPDIAQALDRIAGALTQPHSSRPGYRQEWKP